jgi:hypothetical protein
MWRMAIFTSQAAFAGSVHRLRDAFVFHSKECLRRWE